MTWRMSKMCADCPFASSGAGLHLRKSLRPTRWREILRSLRTGNHFVCHKTTSETGDGSNRVCAGAIAWQEKRHCISQLQQIVERMGLFKKVKGKR